MAVLDALEHERQIIDRHRINTEVMIEVQPDDLGRTPIDVNDYLVLVKWAVEGWNNRMAKVPHEGEIS